MALNSGTAATVGGLRHGAERPICWGRVGMADPLQCPSCGTINPSRSEYCDCGVLLPTETEVELQKLQSRVHSRLALGVIGPTGAFVVIILSLGGASQRTGLTLLFLGIGGLLFSSVRTGIGWRRAGLHSYESRDASAGSGIIPAWVSLIGLIAWGCIAAGVGILVYSFWVSLGNEPTNF